MARKASPLNERTYDSSYNHPQPRRATPPAILGRVSHPPRASLNVLPARRLRRGWRPRRGADRGCPALRRDGAGWAGRGRGGAAARAVGGAGAMIGPPPGTRVYLACGVTDMRAGMDRLAALVQQSLGANPFDGAVYLFRGRRGRSLKALWHDGVALSLLVRRLEHGHFPWPMTPTGSVTLSPAQASLLLEGLEWRSAQREWRPTAA